MYNLRAEVEKIFLKNRENRDGFQYTVPSATSYPHQWLWDSCFHAIVLTHFSTNDAKNELRGLMSGQFKNGMIPHIVFRERKGISEHVAWAAENTSSLTQPPLIAYTVWRIYKKDNDRTFLEEMFPKLDSYYRYLLTRDIYGDHLVGIINPDESGEDNSPRFDGVLGLGPKHSFEENNKKRFTMIEENTDWSLKDVQESESFFWINDVPYAVYLIENMECLAGIAGLLGKSDEKHFYTEQIASMRNAMREFMLEDGIFWSVSGREHTKIKVKTWAMFAPLVAGLYTTEEAEKLVKNYLLNKDEFWSNYPVPTTAMSEESYNPNELSTGPAWLQPNWRGPVWVAPSWFVFRGLKRYGFDKIANEIRDRSLALLEKSGFREYYHPMTGQGMGAEDFTWGGLVLDMVEGHADNEVSL